VVHPHPERAAVVTVFLEEVGPADLRRTPEPAEDLANVAVPIVRAEEVGRRVRDGGEDGVAAANRRLESTYVRVGGRASRDGQELGRRRQMLVLLSHDLLPGPPTAGPSAQRLFVEQCRG
jgi:hypothetical protein